MRILLTKISDRRHELEIVRGDGSREAVALVTREFLFHDLLHYAVETAIPTQRGFWGALAHGKTMSDVNDRSGAAMKEYSDTLLPVEATVGMMSGTVNGTVNGTVPADQVVAAVRSHYTSLGEKPPRWWTETFVVEVRERMRQLQGHWRATPYGGVMEILWPQDALQDALPARP